MFRQGENLGSMKNKFSIGMITRLGDRNLDGISRSVYILANCKTQDQELGEKAPIKQYVFHRRIEDVIILQDETTDQIERIIANEEAEAHEELSEGLSDDEEESEEDQEGQPALAVSVSKKPCHSPSFSLLLAMNQWEICSAQGQQDQSGG